jgi:hypothetical protein
MIAVRSSGAARPGAGKDGVLLAGAAAAPVIAGEMLVFCHPVTCAPAVVRRTGEVQAGGWLPDHVRLGVLEAQLGDGVIERLIAASGQAVPQRRQRICPRQPTGPMGRRNRRMSQKHAPAPGKPTSPIRERSQGVADSVYRYAADLARQAGCISARWRPAIVGSPCR